MTMTGRRQPKSDSVPSACLHAPRQRGPRLMRNTDNRVKAIIAGAVEAVMVVMHLHAAKVSGRLETPAKTMRYLTGGNAKYVLHAGNTGAVDAVVAVLRRHSGTAKLQAFANRVCFT